MKKKLLATFQHIYIYIRNLDNFSLENQLVLDSRFWEDERAGRETLWLVMDDG